MINKKDILDAYVFLRRHNHSIPDEVLDFIKESSLNALNLQAIKASIISEIEKERYPDPICVTQVEVNDTIDIMLGIVNKAFE